MENPISDYNEIKETGIDKEAVVKLLKQGLTLEEIQSMYQVDPKVLREFQK